MEAAGYEKRNPAGSSVLIMPVHCTTQTGTRGGGDVLPDVHVAVERKERSTRQGHNTQPSKQTSEKSFDFYKT